MKHETIKSLYKKGAINWNEYVFQLKELDKKEYESFWGKPQLKTN